MNKLRPLALSLLLAACAASSETFEVVPEPPAPLEPVSLEGWRSERIALPPAFAPELPSGDELLLFPPGMFDPEAPDFWSYVFVMRLDEVGITDERLTELFELYYDGLLLAVAGGRGEDIGDDPAQVELRRTGQASFEGRIEMIEAFETLQPIDLRLVIRAMPGGDASTWLRVQASPQPPEHEVWRELEFAVAGLEL